jgi:hypothetical protein
MAGRAIISITAENQFTDWISPTDENYLLFLNLSISGTGWDAIVTLQRKFTQGDDTPHDVEQFNANEEGRICEPEENVLYRLGVKTGDFTSIASGGELNLRLSK